MGKASLELIQLYQYQSLLPGIKEHYGYDSKVIYNILDDSPEDDMKAFIHIIKSHCGKRN